MPTCLRSAGIVEEYRTDTTNILRDFYLPALDCAVSYDRAVGYFTSEGLALAGQGLVAFRSHQGRMRLVASPVLTEEDLQAIRQGLEARTRVVEKRLLEALATGALASDNAVQLAWLVADGRLDIRIAIPRQGNGIFHEKCGIFRDTDGCQVAFAGSANETVGGLISNFEAIDVFFSWDSTATRVNRKVANFDRLWDDRTATLDVVDLPEAVTRGIVEVAQRSSRPVPPKPPLRRRGFAPPANLALRSYQEEAVQAWEAADRQGILSMATGTGKTKTALSAAARLAAEAQSDLALIIVVPFIHLVDQWAQECEDWGLRPTRCYESSESWKATAWEAVDGRRAGARGPVCLITTIATSTGRAFLEVAGHLGGASTLLIADEVHHLGTERNSSILLESFPFRLGLSATPERWADEEGTRRLDEYFGGVVFEFGIGPAIGAGCLCEYVYEPLLVDLDLAELQKYREVIDDLERVREADEPGRAERLQELLRKRSLVLNTASGKLERVRQDIAARPPDRSLFYCASRLQLGATSDVLRESGWLPRAFTAEEGRGERERLLAAFADGTVPAIVAMNALDEGVDVPSTREAHILASSGNPRQFVQRRGRVLRPHPGKSRARIVDYVVVPEGEGDFERELTRREMKRVLEFAQTASNADQARDAIWHLLDRFDLIHLVGGTS
jgi:superfamily II DNA or RNA helicase